MNEKKYDDISCEINVINGIIEGVEDNIRFNLSEDVFYRLRNETELDIIYRDRIDNQMNMLISALENARNQLKEIINKGVYTKYEAENPD